MAFDSGRFVSTVTLVDSAGRKVTREFPHAETTYAACLVTLQNAIVPRLAAITKMKISHYQLAFVVLEQSLTLPSNAVAEDQLLISAPILGKANKRGYLRIPAPTNACFMSTTGQGYNQANFGYSLLDLYLTLFGNLGYCYISDREFIQKVDMRGERVSRTTIRK